MTYIYVIIISFMQAFLLKSLVPGSDGCYHPVGGWNYLVVVKARTWLLIIWYKSPFWLPGHGP